VADDIDTFLATLYAEAVRLYPEWFMQTVVIGRAPRKAIQCTSFRLTNLDAAAAWCETAGKLSDVYCSMGIAETPSVGNTRWSIDQVQKLCGLWLDVDLADAKHPGRPENSGAAEALLWQASEKPTLVVFTGSGGYHGHWVFGEPEEAATAALLCKAWQSQASGGFRLDSTADAARVMRVPGTINQKNGEEARLRGGQLSYRIWPARLDLTVEHMVSGPASPAAGEATGERPLLEGTNGDIVAQAEALLRGDGWDDMVIALYENNPDIRGIVERQGRGHAGWSDNEFDLAVASHADLMGLDAPTTAALMIFSREEFGLNPDHLAKVRSRPKYTVDTIMRGKSHPKIEARRREAESEGSQQTLNL
jgi:hypothetical protein